jgi:V/A-type H+-transporting ATPase subunit I
MFEPAAMTRLSLVILDRDARGVLRYLGRAGVVELTQAAAGPEIASPPSDYRREERANLDQLSTRLENLRRSLPLPPTTGLPDTDEMSSEQAGVRLKELEEESGDLLKHRAELQQRLAELGATAGQMSGYRGVELPLDRPGESSFLHFVTGSLPAKNFAKLEVGGDVALLPLAEQNGRLCLVALTTRSRRPELDRALQMAGFQPEILPVIAGATVDAVADQNQREQEIFSGELAQVNTRLEVLGRRFAPVLAQIETTLANEQRLLEAEQSFSRTQSSVLVTGWIPGEDASALEQRLREITRGRCVINWIAAEKLAGGEIPVLLRHPRWLRPFGALVTAYGLPKYRELEPTLFVAVSFVLMFGMMFGDVGHGAVIAAAGLVALLAGRKPKLRDAGMLLAAGGVSSTVFGLLYGSFFGLESFKRFALWQDPLAGDPMNLMFAAVGIGVAVISLGLVLNIINRFRRRDYLGGWLDKFGVAGLMFYWGALALLTKLPAFQSANLVAPAVMVFLVLPVVGWTLKEPLEFFRHRRAGRPLEPGESWFAAVTESLVGAFEVMLSFLANTISFVRLAAYAMSHAALLLAAFMMADAVKHLPAAGTFLSVAIIILGNIVAIVLEGVIASVQALRLEYYEFFSKFFPGAGRPFKPFRLQTTTVASAPP